MLPLYLLAAHLFGDYLLQNRWMARRKLDSRRWRTYHVTVYTLPFLPIVALYAHTWTRGVLFVVLLFVLHWLTDSRQFRSTFGDFIHWHLVVKPEQRRKEWRHSNGGTDASEAIVGRLPPNTWPLVSSAVDQTLHVIQLAVLGGIFL